jgi:hypothetical protein
MENNIEPYRMNDARSFTDYRPNHELNHEIKKYLCNANNKCCANNYNYKVCLSNTYDNVSSYLSSDPFKNNYVNY